MFKRFIKISLIVFMLFTILLSIKIVLGYSIFEYDDTTSDLIFTNFHNDSYLPFIFTDSSYRSESYLLNDSNKGFTNWLLIRNNYNNKSIIGVSSNITHARGEGTGSQICIGNGITGLYENAGNQLSFYNGYCLWEGAMLISFINGVESNVWVNFGYWWLNPLPLSNIKFYIEDGYIVYIKNDSLIFNISNTDYIADNDTTYMFVGRDFMSSPYNDYINVSDIWDITETEIIPDINITSCGIYERNNTIGFIDLIVDNSPCLELRLNNATMSCSNSINGTGGVFAYIKYMNNSIIENCVLDGFLQGFLIPDGYYDTLYSENNIFRNISIKNLDSGAFGFDIRSMYNQVMNHTEFYNNYIENSYSNTAIVFYGDGMDYFNVHDNFINGSYTGVSAYYTNNLIIENNIINGGTIYGLFLVGLNNPIINNNTINNFAICSMGLNGVSNAIFNNNSNDINNFEMTISKFCIGEYPSTINNLSNYNLGWFPKDKNSNMIGSINETSYYNKSNSQDVYYDDNLSVYYFIHNATKSYFIFPECQENFKKEINPCINGVSLISYKDLNKCETYFTLNIDNNSNENCIITYNNLETETEINTLKAIYFLNILFTILIFILLFKRGVKND